MPSLVIVDPATMGEFNTEFRLVILPEGWKVQFVEGLPFLIVDPDRNLMLVPTTWTVQTRAGDPVGPPPPSLDGIEPPLGIPSVAANSVQTAEASRPE